MPITAKLSREFYDRFGDKVVDELVGLLNQMDASSRAELRELNEQNFRRFEAKLEQRIAELGAELRQELAQLGAELRREIAELGGELRREIGELYGQIGEQGGQLRAEMGGLRADMANLKAELIKWMFLFWLGTVATMLSFGRFFLTG